MQARCVLCLTACILVVSGCSEGKAIDREGLGDEWPFVVDQGVVDCVGTGEVVFRANGTTYALNGTARSQMRNKGYRDDLYILRRDPRYPELFMDTQPVIEIGLRECE